MGLHFRAVGNRMFSSELTGMYLRVSEMQTIIILSKL